MAKIDCFRLRHSQKLNGINDQHERRDESINVNICRTYAIGFGFLSLVWCEIYMFVCGFMVHFSLMRAFGVRTLMEYTILIHKYIISVQCTRDSRFQMEANSHFMMF